LYDLALKPIIRISLVQEDASTLLEAKHVITTRKLKASFGLDAVVRLARRLMGLLLLQFSRISESRSLGSKSKVVSLLDELGNDGGDLRMKRSAVGDVVVLLADEVLAKDINETGSRKLSGVEPLKKTNKDVLADQREFVDHDTILSVAEGSAADLADTDESREVLWRDDRVRKGLEVEDKEASDNLSIVHRRDRAVGTRSGIISIESTTKSGHSRVGEGHIKEPWVCRRAVSEDLEGVVHDIGHQSARSDSLSERKAEDAGGSSCRRSGCRRRNSLSSISRRNLTVHHLFCTVFTTQIKKRDCFTTRRLII